MSSTPAPLAASDPGGADPKREKAAPLSSVLPAGDSDVTMTEASEEEAPAVAEVKEEGAPAAVVGDGSPTADDAQEAATEADPLLAAESAGMAEPAQAGDVAESSELEENHVNDNGVAHFDEETQNGPESSVQCARYTLPPLDKDGFRVSDLVWGKVKSHPWWPGEIFDPSNASELALKHQRKGSRLVAYFGDNSFAWCDESQLKPFVTNYSQMEKQSSQDAFVGSVNYALEELSRRILSGMSCSCLPEELSDNGMSYMVENAGLRDGVTCSAVNRSEILTCFSSENLLNYIRSLALLPGQGGDLLELVIACSQLTSLYRSKGCPELASFQTGSGWVEDDMDISSTNNVVIEEVVVAEAPPPVEVKPKRGRGRPRKIKPEDNLELTGKKGTSSVSSNNASYSTPQSVKDFHDLDSNKKKRSLDTLEDSDATPALGGSFKIGECIRRAATQLTGSSSAVKSQNEPENAEFDVSSDDAANELTVEKCAKRRRMHKHRIADPKELFSQLCSVSVEPMDKYNSSAMIISYFSDYRNYVVSAATEASVIEKTASKRGRKKKVLPSPELETTDHMQDSYWSGLSLHNHPIHSLKRVVTNTRPKRKRKSLYGTDLSLVQQEEVAPKKQIQVIERSIIHVDEKIVDEWKPTALVLSFGRSTALPSETDLVKKFGRYGPLKESEIEVQKNTNTVKIVFKKRADAERAFSDAGKYGTFGPLLRSYRLVKMPFSLGASEPTKPEVHPGDHGPEIPGSNKSEVSLVTMKVNQVGKTEKSEAVKAQSVEQVETAKKTCQSEPVKSSGEKVETAQQACQSEADMVKKTGQIDAELTVPSDQIGSAKHSGQAEAVAKESSEQVSTMEQAYSQDEASLKNQSDIALSGAATGAVQVAGAIGADREEPVNKSANHITEVDNENKALTEESVNQVATEQVKAPSDVVPSGSLDVQGSELQPETVQFQAVGGTSTEQEGTTAEADTVQDVTEASVQEAGLNKLIVEPKTVEVASQQVSCTEQTVQVKDIIDASGGHTDVGKQTAEEVTMAEAMVEGAVESKVEAPIEKTVEDKATAGTLGEAIESTTTAEVLGHEMENTNATEVPDERITEAGNTIGDVTVEAPDKKAATAEKTVEAGMVEAPEEKTTVVERIIDGVAVKAPHEKATEAKRIVEGVPVEAPDAKSITAEEPDAMAEAPDEKATAAKNTSEDATVEAPEEKATTSEKNADDAKVEAPDEKATTAEEGATVEAQVGGVTEQTS